MSMVHLAKLTRNPENPERTPEFPIHSGLMESQFRWSFGVTSSRFYDPGFKCFCSKTAL